MGIQNEINNIIAECGYDLWYEEEEEEFKDLPPFTKEELKILHRHLGIEE